MDGLKEELKDSFIKPLRFKFLVEKMKENSIVPVIAKNEAIQVPENTENGLLRASQ